MTLTHPRSTSRRLATVILLALLGTLAAALTAGAAYADGTVVTGNQNCVDLIPGSEELRVQSPADGTFSNPDGFSVTLDVRTLTADDPQHPGDQTDSPVFDFTATGGTVVGVAVKGGPDANFYDYRPDGVSSGTGLHAPMNTRRGRRPRLVRPLWTVSRRPSSWRAWTARRSAIWRNLSVIIQAAAERCGGNPQTTAVRSGGGPQDNERSSIAVREDEPVGLSCDPAADSRPANGGPGLPALHAHIQAT